MDARESEGAVEALAQEAHARERVGLALGRDIDEVADVESEEPADVRCRAAAPAARAPLKPAACALTSSERASYAAAITASACASEGAALASAMIGFSWAAGTRASIASVVTA